LAIRPLAAGGGAVQGLLGEQPGLDPAGQVDLLLGGEQPDPADFAQVLAEQVGGGAGGVVQGRQGGTGLGVPRLGGVGAPVGPGGRFGRVRGVLGPRRAGLWGHPALRVGRAGGAVVHGAVVGGDGLGPAGCC
jgi:hypothetical protein